MGQVTTPRRILVVDDDPTVSDVLRRYLERAGYAVEHAADGPAALASFAGTRPDLVLLDLMLPGIDGLEVCRRLRADAEAVPVIMLTALGDEADRITGLRLGADDYVTKPFSPRELVLRVQSVLRRVTGAGGPARATDPLAAGGPPAGGPPGNGGPAGNGGGGLLVDGDLVVDRQRRLARRGGEELALTVREFDLLVFFLRHPGRAFGRAELLAQVWGWTFGDQATVTVHVRRLREKIEPDPAGPRRIVTVWGVGYRYETGNA
ncbi:response regulator transcription factor [Solwaraspora sp. WMMD1047]|uniref:response regulator transcription factor n=1 Tax=Solwaraspora sp. WMMD1047 TaxID=3016102 RepID=UPI002417F8CD|nr:response regulator transcription factor [Solwaraspora sp. WMMD1047]MDG4828312.1 response regulator transcription factor [Solwaraspora sp. WMMD1047]